MEVGLMQHRMKTHPLTKEQISNLLSKVQTGSLATINADGTPYVTPVHFVFFEDEIYIHGLPKGQKIDNIIRSDKVGFSAYEMKGLIFDEDEKPCDTNTEYESVIVTGNACLIDNMEKKKIVLQKIIDKYSPQLSDKPLPDNMVLGTAVIKISITELTGKFYK